GGRVRTGRLDEAHRGRQRRAGPRRRGGAGGRMSPLLEVSGLTKTFGGLSALSELDLEVAEGEVVSVIGPNGAGKTTFFNVLTGLYRPDRGHAIFDGHDLVGFPSN